MDVYFRTFPIMMNVVGSMIMATPENDYYSVVGAWCCAFYHICVPIGLTPSQLSQMLMLLNE
jgi:hypothetical protein